MSWENARDWCDIPRFLSNLHRTRQTHFGARAAGLSRITKSAHFPKENSALIRHLCTKILSTQDIAV
jgi:hypothetical protein